MPEHREPDVDDHTRNVQLIAAIKRLSAYYPLTADDDYKYVIVHGVRLPPGFNWQETNVLVDLPDDYPYSPPGIGSNRVYLPPQLRYLQRRLKDLHDHIRPDHWTPDWGPWAWFCYETIDWDPRHDDLIKFMEMVRADLTDPPTL
jgi:hypothetical protein